MAFNTTTTGVGGVLPQQYTGDLLLTALRESTLALDPRVVTELITPNYQVHLPILTGDATGTWVAEASEIPESDPTLAELVVVPKKVGAISVVSSEAADDSNPDAAALIGQSLATGLGATIDTAFFASTTSNGPSGLGSLSVNAVDAGSAWANLDPFADAQANAESHGTSVTAFVGSYADVSALSKLKSGTGYSTPLLGMDPSQAGQRTIFGVPLIASSKATTGTMYALCRDRIVTVVRQDVVVETSTDARFTSDQVVLRGKARVAFAYLSPASLSKISLSS